MENRSFLPALQLFRGVAALMVVFHHLWHEIRHAFGLHFPVVDQLALAGKYGVDFFFVLSGFIICYSHFSRLGNRAEALPYLSNRLLRIYVPYLPICVLMLIAYRLLPSLSYTDNGSTVSWVKSITLLPLRGDTALSVAWTLVFEMIFYLVFLVAFFSKRLFFAILGAWVVLIVAGNSHNDDVLLSPYILEFILGVSAAILVHRLSPARIPMVVAFLFPVLLVLWFSPVFLQNRVLLGLTFVLIILCTIWSPLNRLPSRNLLMILGNASYSIYLVHNPAISAILRVFPKTGNFPYMVALTVFLFVCTCVLGVVYHKIFEVRLTSRIRQVKARYFTRRPFALNHGL
jgi:peptidoglycan/LPS O-acetylase OafA/YrhL